MATKRIAWNTGSGNITLTYTGQGNGTIAVQSDANDLGSARSQTIVVQTTAGGVIARNLTVSQAACPVPVGTVLSYSYTGSYQEVELPAGQYKLQCWGAQGGSNAAASSYGITAQAGGKGGYSEGIITLSQKTTLRVYVGGQGSSSAGGFNGGGSTTGSSTYNASNEQGVSRMGGGGGATDIRLSDGALLSRMIVAGGGAGGAMCYQKKTTTTTTWTLVATLTLRFWDVMPEAHNFGDMSTDNYGANTVNFEDNKTYKIDCSGTTLRVVHRDSNGNYVGGDPWDVASGTSFTVPRINSSDTVRRVIAHNTWSTSGVVTAKVYRQDTTSSTTTSTDYQVGGVGGGTQGGAYSSTYAGKQNAAGSGGSFGQGANQTITNYRYCSGAGGGGWYGGGSSYSDSSMTNCKYSGGGSGFVNTAASAGNRPSGYTGLELDSGETKAGNTSFPNTAGTGNETGHSGNGYAKITRLS